MNKKKNMTFCGVCCEKCMDGIMKSMPEIVLEDGTVVHSAKCNNCDHIEEYYIEPKRSTRSTGVTRCNKCGFEYFYINTRVNLKDIIDFLEVSLQCPSCGIKGFQEKLTEEYGELKHKHGSYGMHSITRKHNVRI
jgi:hypothetical protein